MFAEFVVDLVRVVAGEDPGFVADSSDRMRDVGFFAFAADKDASGIDVARDIFAHFLLGPEIQEAFARIMLNMGFPGTVETFQANEKPSYAAFHKTELDVGKLVEDAVEDHAAEGDHLAEGMSQRVNRRIRAQIIQS